jgi:hypothetical protein
MLCGAVSAQADTFVYDGISYNCVTTAKAFVDAYLNDIPAAVRFKANDYLKVTREISEICRQQSIDITMVFSPVDIVSYTRKEKYSASNALRLAMGNTITPNEDVLLFNKAVPKTAAVSIEDTTNNLRYYFKYLALLWWGLQAKGSTKVCDSMNVPIEYNEGYIYGYVEGERLYAYRLFCNELMEEKLDNFKNSGGRSGDFDESDIRRANEFAKTEEYLEVVQIIKLFELMKMQDEIMKTFDFPKSSE